MCGCACVFKSVCVGVLFINPISRKSREHYTILGFEGALGMIGLRAATLSHRVMADRSADKKEQNARGLQRSPAGPQREHCPSVIREWSGRLFAWGLAGGVEGGA